MEVSEDQASKTSKGQDLEFHPQKTNAFPLSILYTEKFQILDDSEWRKQDHDKYNFKKTSASVELLNAEEAMKFDVNGGLADNSIVNAGFPLPKEIIAVVRPKSCGKKVQGDNGAHPSSQMCRTDQKSILPEGMEMNLEVKLFDFVPPESRVTKRHTDPAKVVYTCKAKACTKSNVKGLYCFSTEGNQLENIFKKMGTYMFNFSLVGSKYGNVPPAVVRVNVAASDKPDQWRLCSHLGQCTTGYGSRKKRNIKSRRSFEADADGPMQPDKKDVTLIHVTTLDEVVSVNSFFTIAVFLGLAFNPPLPTVLVATSLAPPRIDCYPNVDVYRALVVWEVISFSCFLFSSLVAHGFKLFIVLGNGKDKENSKSAKVNLKFLRFGILAAGVGAFLGAVFLIMSMVVLIEVRLGSLFCGNPWALRAAIPLLALGISGCAIFILSVLYESFLE